MKRKRMTFTVSLEPPPGATAQDVRAYILDAVQSMKGAYPPDEPIVDLDRDTVKVTRKREAPHA